MRTRIILMAPLLVALAGCQPEVPQQYAARANDWLLAKNTGCFQCHITGKDRLGPAWEKVSERYRNDPDAEARLMNKVKNGGGGAWISKEMPGYSDNLLSEADRKTLVKFILSLK